MGKLLRPLDDEQNEHKQKQLRELALINGTLRCARGQLEVLVFVMCNKHPRTNLFPVTNVLGIHFLVSSSCLSGTF